MKVPTYTEQLQTKREVPGQRLSVQASPQQFSRVSDAAQKFYSQAEDAAFQYAQIEARQTNESQRLGALNESRRLLAESSEAAAEMARNDPDAAEQYMRESAELYRENLQRGLATKQLGSSFYCNTIPRQIRFRQQFAVSPGRYERKIQLQPGRKEKLTWQMKQQMGIQLLLWNCSATLNKA